MKCSAALTNSGSGSGTCTGSGSATCTGSGSGTCTGSGSSTCTGSGTGSGSGTITGSSLPRPMSKAPENASSSAFATNFWFEVSSVGSGSGVFATEGNSTKSFTATGSEV